MKSHSYYLGQIQGVVELNEESDGDKASAFDRISEIIKESATPDTVGEGANQKKTALALKIADEIQAKAKDSSDQLAVMSIACQLLFTHGVRITFE